MTTLRSRINQSGGGRMQSYGNFGDIYSPDPHLRAIKPEPTCYRPAPYLIQKSTIPRGSDPSLRYQLVARHKLPEVPVLRSNLVVPDVGGVLEEVPISFRERQTASIVASLKKLAGESSGLFGGLASKIGQILNLNLSKAQIDKIDSISKADELSFLRDLQRVALNQKDEEKPNIDRILGRIKDDGRYTALEEKQLDDLDAYLAGEEPKIEPVVEPEEEEKKHDVSEEGYYEPIPPPPSQSEDLPPTSEEVEQIYGTFPGTQRYVSAIDDARSKGLEIIGYQSHHLGSRPVFTGPEGGHFTFTTSGNKAYIR